MAAWTNLAMGLGSIGLGIGATAVTLRWWPSSGAHQGSTRCRLIPGIPARQHQLSEYRPGRPYRADLGRHCGRQRRLRPPPSRSALSGYTTRGLADGTRAVGGGGVPLKPGVAQHFPHESSVPFRRHGFPQTSIRIMP